MSNRWSILALLFAVRATMAFQFQSIAALAPLIRRDFGVNLADIGLAIGLYLAPGIALAVPGGAIGKRYGDKAVVMAGLGLMLCGGLIMAVSASWGHQLAGRLLAGIGGVLLNVLMSKMVTDWFAGKEIATAMAIFVNSWAFGIALALIVLPMVGTQVGVAAASLLTAGLIAAGLIALALLYPAGPRGDLGTSGSAHLDGRTTRAVIVAGLLWGLYNASIGMVFGFGPTMLAEQGWTLAAASSTTSVALWLVAVSVPIGGVLADRSGHGDAVLIGGCLAFAAALVFATRTDAVLPAFVAIGLASGLAAGPILTLPVSVLAPAARAVGMGLFFACFYLCVVLAPWIGGMLANATGSSRVTFDLGAGMLGACCLTLWIFRRMAVKP
jgi:predicted MFS family arabinose efflux permease